MQNFKPHENGVKDETWKELTLTNVAHVPKIQKNLISRSCLSKNDFKLVFEFDKFVLTKSGCLWVEAIYVLSFLKLNVMTIVPKLKKIESSDL